jgi:hypothetical protein
MRFLFLTALSISFIAVGCDGGEAIQPYRDFPVVAAAKSGDTTVYLSELRRLGKKILLTFRYEEPESTPSRASIVCTEVTGGTKTEFDPKIIKDGWVELTCKTDYPIDAQEIGFSLRMCEEPSCDNADAVLTAGVPPVGEVSKPAVSCRAGDIEFSVDVVAYLRGDSWPDLDGVPGENGRAIPYGDKTVVLKDGSEGTIVVICKTQFKSAIPDVPRGYSEWDQVVITDGDGDELGGVPISTSDVENARYFALVSVGRKQTPGRIKACFFNSSTLQSLRREFVFLGLPNPRE